MNNVKIEERKKEKIKKRRKNIFNRNMVYLVSGNQETYPGVVKSG